jgi:hypothetical protein
MPFENAFDKWLASRRAEIEENKKLATQLLQRKQEHEDTLALERERESHMETQRQAERDLQTRRENSMEAQRAWEQKQTDEATKRAQNADVIKGIQTGAIRRQQPGVSVAGGATYSPDMFLPAEQDGAGNRYVPTTQEEQQKNTFKLSDNQQQHLQDIAESYAKHMGYKPGTKEFQDAVNIRMLGHIIEPPTTKQGADALIHQEILSSPKYRDPKTGELNVSKAIQGLLDYERKEAEATRGPEQGAMAGEAVARTALIKHQLAQSIADDEGRRAFGSAHSQALQKYGPTDPKLEPEIGRLLDSARDAQKFDPKDKAHNDLIHSRATEEFNKFRQQKAANPSLLQQLGIGVPEVTKQPQPVTPQTPAPQLQQIPRPQGAVVPNPQGITLSPGDQEYLNQILGNK